MTVIKDLYRCRGLQRYRRQAKSGIGGAATEGYVFGGLIRHFDDPRRWNDEFGVLAKLAGDGEQGRIKALRFVVVAQMAP